MNTIRNQPIFRNLFRTIVYLCFGSGVTLLIMIFILLALGQNKSNNFAVLFLAMGVSAGVGGSLWARSIIKDRLKGSVWSAALKPGIVFGVLIFLSAYALEMIEQYLFYSNGLQGPGAHLQFLALFSAAVYLVATVTSTVLAAQVLDMDGQQALRHGLVTGLVCAALFIAADLFMVALGWRVGDPDFPERLTMFTVMSIGLSVALVAGGTLLGVRLDQSGEEKDEK